MIIRYSSDYSHYINQFIYFKIKKILLLMTVAFCSTAISAQNVGGGRYADSDMSKGWTSLYVQYNNIGVSHEKVDDWGFDVYGWKPKETMNGVSLGVSHAFNVIPNIPLYVETGLGVQLAFYSDKLEDVQDRGREIYIYAVENSGHLLSAKVPLNVLYHFGIPNTDFAIEPYTGFDFRVNILGKGKSISTDTYTYNQENIGEIL